MATVQLTDSRSRLTEPRYHGEPYGDDGLLSASGTSPLTLTLAAKALTGSLAVTPANPGGAVALQATSPGTIQTGNDALTGVRQGQIRDKGGQVFNAAAYASVNAAVTAIGATPAVLLVADAQTLAASLTIPATLSLWITRGGSITKASTYTLTINGPMDAGRYAVFVGFSSGDVTFGVGSTDHVLPEWFGASNADSADAGVQAATTAALNASVAAGKRVSLAANSTYPTNAHVAIPTAGLSIVGNGATRSCRIKNYNAAGDHAIWIGNSSEPYPDAATDNGSHLDDRIVLSGFSVIGNASSGAGVRIYNASVSLEDLYLYGNGTDGVYVNKGWASSYRRLTLQSNNRHGVYAYGDNTMIEMSHCGFISSPQIDGLRLAGGNGGSLAWKITNCDFEGLTAGIYFDTSTGMIRGIVLDGCNFEGANTKAIDQAGTGNLDNLTMISPNFADSSQTVTFANLRWSTIISPTLIGNTFTVSGATDVVMLDPSSSGATIYGVSTQSASDHALLGYGAISGVTGNTIGYLTHQYGGASGNDHMSLAVNFRRTSGTAGTIPTAGMRTAEVRVSTGGSENSRVTIATVAATNTVPLDRFWVDENGVLFASAVPSYANNAAAVAALGAGGIYYTDSGGEYILKVAH